MGLFEKGWSPEMWSLYQSLSITLIEVRSILEYQKYIITIITINILCYTAAF
jgi:hypothetical protein